MKQSEVAVFLPLIKAWSEGKTLQIKSGIVWHDLCEVHDFNMGLYQYRIKREPREWYLKLHNGVPVGYFSEPIDSSYIKVREVME